MTQVEMIYHNNIIIGFNMKGHAGFNVGGPDILCASLSTASQMTLNGILDWAGLSVEDVVKESNKKEGVLRVLVSPRDDNNGVITMHQLFRSFEMFIEQLEEQYEGYVSLERRQVREDDYKVN